jgi:hypothetical protein
MRLILVLAMTLALITTGEAAASECASVRVPGAAKQRMSCLDDLTTTGTLATGHTVQADWAGLTSAGLPAPSGVPGIQIDGYFPDTSTSNTAHGWNHDAQFVLRLPERWNGGLVVSGSPGVRDGQAISRPPVRCDDRQAGRFVGDEDRAARLLGRHSLRSPVRRCSLSAS